MSDEFKVVVSSADDLSGTRDAASAAAAPDWLARAAARTPDASLEALAASARRAQASAEAARQPMAGLVNAPDAVLAKLAAGFGIDSRSEIIESVERGGQVSTGASPRPPEVSGEEAPTAGPAARRKDDDGEASGQPPTPSRGDPGEPRTGLPARWPDTAARLVEDTGGFPAAPTAAASLGQALAGPGASSPSPTLAPEAPTMGGPAGAAGPGAGKAGADGRPFVEADRPVDDPPAASNQGFQTLDERLARVEQTTREHTSQISNRS